MPTPVNSAGHTPGPWIVKGRVHSSGEAIRVESHHPSADHRLYQVCDVLDANGYPQNHANLRLIAAAPDLLDALQSIVADHEHCGDDWGDRREAWIETARAAIARATGETQ